MLSLEDWESIVQAVFELENSNTFLQYKSEDKLYTQL
jgi:hypothetical protein